MPNLPLRAHPRPPAQRTGPRPPKRSLLGDLNRAKTIIGWSGTAIVALVLGAPAGLSTLLGVEGATDPVSAFITVLLFTLPLSLGILVWAIGLPSIDNSWAGIVWTTLVLIGAAALSQVMGGAPVRASGGASSVPEAGLKLLIAFFEAYGPVAFFGAIIAGGTLAYLYFDMVYPRITGREI
jgi:hypothetical protein